jgi:hypothetical protein
MIGRLCKFYQSYNHTTCLSMTLKQLLGMYWESYRQEARDRMKFIADIAITQIGGDPLKEKMSELEMQANPPDPEADGVMDKGSMGQLRDLMAMVNKQHG